MTGVFLVFFGKSRAISGMAHVKTHWHTAEAVFSASGPGQTGRWSLSSPGPGTRGLAELRTDVSCLVAL